MSISAEGGDTNLNANETLQLKAITIPTEITDTIEWSSSDNNIATVDNTGLVKGISNGNVTINVKVKDNDGNELKRATYGVKIVTPIKK